MGVSTVPLGIIDCDVHPTLPTISAFLPYMSDMWRRRLEERGSLSLQQRIPGRAWRFTGGASNLRPDATPPGGGAPGSDPDFMLKDHFDRNQIEAGILLPIEPARVDMWTNPDEAAAIAAAGNELIKNEWLSRDPRFRLAMVVSPWDPQLAAAEIRRFGGNNQVVAVWLPIINRLIGDRFFYPIYEAAAEHQLPIMLHPTGSDGDFMGAPEYAGGLVPSRQERYNLLAQFGMSHTSSLIFEGVFERYPHLKVVMAEFGWTWVPSFMWRMDATWKAGRTSFPWLKKAPSEYVSDHIRFTTEPALEPPTEKHAAQILEWMDAGRTVLYSSDYPHWDGDEPAAVFKTASSDLKRRIFRESAIEVYPRLGVKTPTKKAMEVAQ
jgi:uncharacterized protein